jgi:hypothetical protein
MVRLLVSPGVVSVYFTVPLASVTPAVPPLAGNTGASEPDEALTATGTFGSSWLLASRTKAVTVAGTELSDGMEATLDSTTTEVTLTAALAVDDALEAKELPLSLPPPPHAASASVARQTRIPELRISVHLSC